MVLVKLCSVDVHPARRATRLSVDGVLCTYMFEDVDGANGDGSSSTIMLKYFLLYDEEDHDANDDIDDEEPSITFCRL